VCSGVLSFFLIIAAEHLGEVKACSCDGLGRCWHATLLRWGRRNGTLTSPVDWAYIMSSSGLSRKAMAFWRLSALAKSSFSTLMPLEGRC
jgi:hypothetical protein